ncbi:MULTISPECIES: YggT family protein [unclassified Helicobacter]|uniref:YggT family protein n=1 Tax=unclassified Helicobacter TaxID=2593540 RepID=UPI000CF07314|nr:MULTISPECIES: YggT family protein [unclassified Helicobacter]
MLVNELILILHYLINIYIWIVIIASLMTWFRVDYSHPIPRFLIQVTNPVFEFLRSKITLQYQGMDFAPLVVVLVLSIIDRMLLGVF